MDLLKAGGGERQCLSLAKQLDTLGHDVVVYTNYYDREKCFPEICEGLKIKNVGESDLIRKSPKIPSVLRCYLNMRKLAANMDLKFDVVNPHHWPLHWAAVAYKLKWNTPVVWMCNDYPFPVEPKFNIFSLIKYKLYYLYDRSKVRHIDRVVTLDSKMKNAMSGKYGSKTTIVRSGVDLEKFKPMSENPGNKIRRRHGIEDDDFLLLCLSGLLPHRRIEDCVDAIRFLRKEEHNVKLLIVGSLEWDREYSDSIKTLITDFHLEERAILCGVVPERDIVGYYHSCDGFLFPNDKQTWGLTAIEAMACGKPVIVSKGSGVHEVLNDRETALLVSPGKPKQIAEAVKELMENTGLRESIGKNGLKFVQKTFSWGKYAEGMLQVFQSCISESKEQITDVSKKVKNIQPQT